MLVILISSNNIGAFEEDKWCPKMLKPGHPLFNKTTPGQETSVVCLAKFIIYNKYSFTLDTFNEEGHAQTLFDVGNYSSNNICLFVGLFLLSRGDYGKNEFI